MKYRKDCTCHCHEPGMQVKHVAACCRPDPCGKLVGNRPYWMGVDQYDACHCLLASNHSGDCKCKHLLEE